MGSNFSRQICCVTCGRCKKREPEEANEETSETKPILQTSGETSIRIDTQPSTPALEVSEQGSEEVQSLSQDQQPSADAAEESTETCSAADPMGMTEGGQAASDSMGFLMAPADGETKGEVKGLTQADNQQEKVGNMEEKIKPVPHALEAQPVTHTALDVKLIADIEQPDEQAEAAGEGSPCPGITLQERNTLNFIEITNETASGQDCGIKPPAEPGESLIGRNSLLSPVQMAEETETYLSAEHTEETDRAKLAEVSPQSATTAELVSLGETVSLLTVKAMQKTRETADPLEIIANGMAEMYSTSAMPSESLYPEGEPLEPANQPDFLEQVTQFSMPAAQEMESLRCAEAAELSEALHQSSDGILDELADKESRECDSETAASEAEPQHRIMHQTTELPEEPVTCVQIPVKQAAECLTVAPSLSTALGSSGEIEAEDVEACDP